MTENLSKKSINNITDLVVKFQAYSSGNTRIRETTYKNSK